MKTLTRMSKVEIPPKPEDFVLPEEQVELLTLYRDKLYKHLSELRSKDEDLIDIEVDTLKKILTEK